MLRTPRLIACDVSQVFWAVLTMPAAKAQTLRCAAFVAVEILIGIDLRGAPDAGVNRH
jgi:hypothetical protein